jgi:hypothetical protein
LPLLKNPKIFDYYIPRFSMFTRCRYEPAIKSPLSNHRVYSLN